MFQSWTADPQKAAVAGGDTGILSSSLKTTAGRKKAVILVLNKPDTFAANEMTYLGLSNDADQKWVDLDWKEVAMPTSASWYSVCYGGGKFVAVGWNTNKAAYSTDGINWTESTLPSSADLRSSTEWNSVYYGGGKFVAVNSYSDKTAYSTDGIHWTESNMPLSVWWYSVCYGGGKFVTVEWRSNKAAYSTDGINWTTSTLPSKTLWYSVCYGDGKFVAVTHESKAAYADENLVVKSNTGLGNTALKNALGDGSPSGVTTLTTQACNKLKSFYGDDIRIYLIKYRKSSGDYTYLDTCATSTGGKSYDVANSTALKTTLDTIASDLKSWAGYTEARVVN